MSGQRSMLQTRAQELGISPKTLRARSLRSEASGWEICLQPLQAWRRTGGQSMNTPPTSPSKTNLTRWMESSGCEGQIFWDRSPHGDWVRFTDARAEIERLERELADVRDALTGAQALIESQRRVIARMERELKESEREKSDVAAERSWQERQGDEYGSY